MHPAAAHSNLTTHVGAALAHAVAPILHRNSLAESTRVEYGECKATEATANMYARCAMATLFDMLPANVDSGSTSDTPAQCFAK